MLLKNFHNMIWTEMHPIVLNYLIPAISTPETENSPNTRAWTTKEMSFSINSSKKISCSSKRTMNFTINFLIWNPSNSSSKKHTRIDSTISRMKDTIFYKCFRQDRVRLRVEWGQGTRVSTISRRVCIQVSQKYLMTPCMNSTFQLQAHFLTSQPTCWMQ